MVRSSVKEKPTGRFAGLGLQVYTSRRKIATAGAAVLALGLGYHVMFGRNGLLLYEQKRMDSKTLDGELRSLQHENEQLKAHVERLQNDPDAIAVEAREELHYARAGEVIYRLPNPPAKK